jgi:hypothetical protein
MANYTGIQGQNILITDTDPANPTEGQIWYNSTSNLLKGYANVIVAAAWASGGNVNTARSALGASIGGTQTAALGFGGLNPSKSAATESYNGSSWTTVNSMNSARGILAGAGTQTAALGFGGYKAGDAPPNQSKNSNETESWNGTSWSPVNPLNTVRYALSGAGLQTAALGFGGYTDPPAGGARNSTESWNGTSWTNVNPMNTTMLSGSGLGTQTAALAFGGIIPPTGNQTESWNGTSWTISPATLNTGRRQAAAAGTQTAGLAFGGQALPITPAVTGATELWNGTSWTTSPVSMNTARREFGGCGTQTSALGFAGFSAGGTYPNATEEWTGASVSLQTRTITTS